MTEQIAFMNGHRYRLVTMAEPAPTANLTSNPSLMHAVTRPVMSPRK